jgi:dephospho-CoA kinase
MLKMGLTGGIASGKSTVAAMLRELGFPVIEADRVAHKFLEPGQAAHNEVLQEFGVAIADANERIDRAKLAAIVFADPAKLAKLNAILHPRVEHFVFQQFTEWERQGIQDVAFVEAALLVEAGFTKSLDGLVVTFCKPEQQLERLLARGMSETEAKRRITAQMPVEEKLRYATETIDCSRTIEETRAQVEALGNRLRKAEIRK